MNDKSLLALSQALLSDTSVSKQFLQHLFPDESRFQHLLKRWLERPCSTPESEWIRILWADATLQPMLRDLVLSLLFGVPYFQSKIQASATPEPYFQGRLWDYLKAHPLGISGGYFGHWSYPPELR